MAIRAPDGANKVKQGFVQKVDGRLTRQWVRMEVLLEPFLLDCTSKEVQLCNKVKQTFVQKVDGRLTLQWVRMEVRA